MPEIDFTNTPEPSDYSLLPDGEYLCELQTATLKTSRAGDDFFRLEFVVLEGPCTGRKIFDSLLWHTEAVLNRAKLICGRLGLDVSGKCKVTSDILQGRRIYVTVEGTDSYEDREGKQRERNIVPFAGYRKLDGDESGESKEDLPF